MTDYTAELFILGGIVLTAVLGWVGSLIVKRFREPTRIETLWVRLDELTKEIYGDQSTGAPGLKLRLEHTERRDASKGRIIRALVRQWPGDDIPHLNPADMQDLEDDTIPMHWKVTP